jgi:hypothetical protein
MKDDNQKGKFTPAWVASLLSPELTAILDSISEAMRSGLSTTKRTSKNSSTLWLETYERLAKAGFAYERWLRENILEEAQDAARRGEMSESEALLLKERSEIFVHFFDILMAQTGEQEKTRSAILAVIESTLIIGALGEIPQGVKQSLNRTLSRKRTEPANLGRRTKGHLVQQIIERVTDPHTRYSFARATDVAACPCPASRAPNPRLASPASSAAQHTY